MGLKEIIYALVPGSIYEETKKLVRYGAELGEQIKRSEMSKERKLFFEENYERISRGLMMQAVTMEAITIGFPFLYLAHEIYNSSLGWGDMVGAGLYYTVFREMMFSSADSFIKRGEEKRKEFFKDDK